jgi:monoamine oxidase
VAGPRFVAAPDGRPDVVVVGAGFAGAAAARKLTRDGLRVLIVEARDRVGGRIWFEPERLDGWPAELGGAFVFDRDLYPLLWAEIDRHGLELEWGSPAETELLWHTAGQLRSGSLPVPFGELESLERSLAHVRAAAARIDADVPLEEQDIADLDVSAEAFFGQVMLGPHTRDLWRAHIANLAGDDWDVPSVLPLLAGVAAAGGSVVAASFFDAPVDTPLARTQGPQLRHGTRALHAAVLGESDADILLGARVTAVREPADGVTVDFTGGSVDAGVVVVAVPLSVVAEIAFDPALPDAHREISRAGVAGRAEKVSALVSGCPRPFYAHGYPAQGGFASAATTVHDGDRAVVVGFTTHPGALDPNDAAAVQAALRAYCPSVVVHASAGHDWTGDPFARGTWSYYRPGQILRVGELTRPRGRVLFAGSDYDRRLGMEGALATGMAAADAARELLRQA